MLRNLMHKLYNEPFKFLWVLCVTHLVVQGQASDEEKLQDLNNGYILEAIQQDDGQDWNKPNLENIEKDHLFLSDNLATSLNEENDHQNDELVWQKTEESPDDLKEDYELQDGVYWDENGEYQGDDRGIVLSRHKRSSENSTESKSVWEEIEEFYSDKNNMAMYCVLPIMVLVYGGCSAIYCVHKCRQYIRRKKHKRLKEEDTDSLDSNKNDLNIEDSTSHPEAQRPVSQISHAWSDLQQSDNVQWSAQTEAHPGGKSPLPWAVNEEATTAAAAAALGYTSTRSRSTMSRDSYLSDKLKDDDITLEEGRRSQAAQPVRQASRSGQLNDRLVQESSNDTLNTIHVVSATTTATAVASSSTDDDVVEPPKRQPPPKVPPPRPPGEKSRAEANFADYATNRSSTLKATDYSRFSDSKPIEIIPLSADPNLRVWDPLHKVPFGEQPSRAPPKIKPMGEAAASSGRDSRQAMKEEMLARYDALSTYQMAKKAAEILQTNAVEKSPFQRKPNKKKHIFIAE